MARVQDPETDRVFEVPDPWLDHQRCIDEGEPCMRDRCPFRGNGEGKITHHNLDEAQRRLERFLQAAQRRDRQAGMEQERRQRAVLDLRSALNGGLDRGGPRR